MSFEGVLVKGPGRCISLLLGRRQQCMHRRSCGSASLQRGGRRAKEAVPMNGVDDGIGAVTRVAFSHEVLCPAASHGPADGEGSDCERERQIEGG